MLTVKSLPKEHHENLFDPENPDYSIDMSDNELNNELEDDHECQEDDHYEFEC